MLLHRAGFYLFIYFSLVLSSMSLAANSRHPPNQHPSTLHPSDIIDSRGFAFDVKLYEILMQVHRRSSDYPGTLK